MRPDPDTFDMDTHSEQCWAWGGEKHYRCAVNLIVKQSTEIMDLRHQLSVAKNALFQSQEAAKLATFRDDMRGSVPANVQDVGALRITTDGVLQIKRLFGLTCGNSRHRICP